VVEHKPWVYKNIPIPPGIFELKGSCVSVQGSELASLSLVATLACQRQCDFDAQVQSS